MKEKKLTIAVITVLAIAVVLGLVLGTKELAPKKEFNNLTLDTYLELMSSNDKSIIYIGSSTCSHCINFSPVLKTVAGKYDLAINYFDINTISDEDTYQNVFIASNSFYSETNWGTPTILIVENGKVLDSYQGETTADVISEFFKENKLIK